jgi:hypothetical protein
MVVCGESSVDLNQTNQVPAFCLAQFSVRRIPMKFELVTSPNSRSHLQQVARASFVALQLQRWASGLMPWRAKPATLPTLMNRP